MTTLTIRRHGPGWGPAALSFLENIVGGIAEGHEMAARYKELNRLTDTELASRGLTREQVPQAAVHGVAAR